VSIKCSKRAMFVNRDFLRGSQLMLHKIRKAMEDRDAQYALAGIVELDDS